LIADRPGNLVRNYQLAEHVRACITPAGAVFLNLKQDAYSGIDARQVNALAGAVEGWPEGSAGDAEPSSDTQALVESLCAEGALVPCTQPGLPYSPSQLHEPTDELMPWRAMQPMKVRVRDVLSFIRALVTVIWMLRFRSLNAAAKRAQRLASRHAVAIDLGRTRELMTLYTYIRMFMFARRGRCLLDSLTLLEFLAAHGVRAQWVIAVRLRPFAAHSWLQHQQWVLNGTPASVRGFSAILTT
jgi:hypothetical protein